MKLIPIASFSTIFDLVVILWSIGIILSRRKSAIKKDALALVFVRGLSCFAVSSFLFSLPGIVIFDLKLIQVVYTLANAFILFAMRYFVVMPLKIFSERESLIKVATWVLTATALAYMTINLVFLQPVEEVYFGSFVDWREATHPIVQVIVWGLSASTVLGITLLFIKKGWSHEDKFIKKRSRVYALGFSFIFLGWLSIFIFTVFTKKTEGILLASGVTGCLLISAGMISLLISSLSKNPSFSGTEEN